MENRKVAVLSISMQSFSFDSSNCLSNDRTSSARYTPRLYVGDTSMREQSSFLLTITCLCVEIEIMWRLRLASKQPGVCFF